MKDKQQYLVPPRFNDKYLLGGFYTVTHLIAIIGTGFFTLIMAMKGAGFLLVIPATLLVMCLRPTSEITVWQYLLLRFNYFNADNMFSLEECKKLWK